MAHEMPTIAVVIPCYNAQADIADAISSVLAQNYPAVEIIVVDDGSSDRSVEIIQSFGTAVRLKICPHLGACHARNRGMEMAQTDFVLFLDADDYLHGPYLSEMAGFAGPDTDIVVGAFARKEIDGMAGVQTYPGPVSFEETVARYLDNFLQTSAFLWRRSFILEAGGWNEVVPVFQDVDFGIRMLLKRPKIAYANPIQGFAVYTQNPLPTRITNTVSRAKVESRLHMLQRYRPALVALKSPSVDRALGALFFELAVYAFATQYFDVGRIAAEEFKSLGFRAPRNSTTLHRLATAMLGLELKTRLSALSYKISGRPRRPPFHLAP